MQAPKSQRCREAGRSERRRLWEDGFFRNRRHRARQCPNRSGGCFHPILPSQPVSSVRPRTKGWHAGAGKDPSPERCNAIRTCPVSVISERITLEFPERHKCLPVPTWCRVHPTGGSESAELLKPAPYCTSQSFRSPSRDVRARVDWAVLETWHL